MRILIWCPYVNLGGGKRLLRPITTALAKHPEIELVRLAIPESAVDILPPPDEKIDVVRLQPAQSHVWSGLGDWHTQRGLLRKMRAFPYYERDRFNVMRLGGVKPLEKDMDLVYVFWPHTVPFQEFDIPVVCMFQDVTLLDYPEIMGDTLTAYERASLSNWLQKSTGLVVSSMNTARRIEKHFGIPADRFNLLSYHNTVLDDVEQDKAVEPPSARVAALPSRYILYPANITVHKNHEALLVAWARFARRQEIPLVLVGDGVQIFSAENRDTPSRNWREDVLRGLMNRLELVPGRDLYAFGYVSDSDLIHLMNKATALIMPTHTEGFGLPVLEALARGVPVLCSDIPVLHETLVGRSADVLWFDPYSPDDIIRKLNTLLDDYDHYKQSAEAGRNDPRPPWPDTADQYVSVFKKILNL